MNGREGGRRGEELKQPICFWSAPPNVTSLHQGIVVILKHHYKEKSVKKTADRRRQWRICHRFPDFGGYESCRTTVCRVLE